MVDSASIVVAVVALVASIGAATVTVWSSYLSEERKNRKESKLLISKYGDPLLLAAQDLQSRLFNLTDWRVCSYLTSGGDKRDNLLLYTAFVFGQWFSCAYILRRKTQFLRLETDGANRKLTEALTDILLEFGEDTYNADGLPFMLWRGDQMAIGQVMTVQEGEELGCMGYAAFRRMCVDAGLVGALEADDEEEGGMRFYGDDRPDDGTADQTGRAEFRRWFLPIVKDVITIAQAKIAVSESTQIAGVAESKAVPDQRLRRLQHLLVDLIDILDPKKLRSEANKMGRCHRAALCECSLCKRKEEGVENTACPCKDCGLKGGRGTA